MPVSTDESHAITPTGQGNGNSGGDNGGRTMYAMNARPGDERPFSFYDDPGKVLIGKAIYNVFVMLATLQSASVLVFLRYRIGKRIMRGWIFFISFLLLITMAGSQGLYAWFSIGKPGVDSIMIIYALLMAGFSIFHYNIGRELTEPTVPQRLQLHTRARGDSWLMLLEDELPVIFLPMWHFYRWRFRIVQVFPPDEPFVQRFIEPLLVCIAGAIFAFLGSLLGYWLMLSAFSLAMVEADYQGSAQEKTDDLYDSQIESSNMRIIRDSITNKSDIPRKMHGITTAGMARVSETLLQLQKQRTQREPDS